PTALSPLSLHDALPIYRRSGLMDSFSTLIRTASHEQHVEAETSTFMSDLLGGRLGVDAYARYTEQLWFVYEALESGAPRLASDPVAGPFIRPELLRQIGRASCRERA